MDAAGGMLLPGLHDHHIHLLALAAAPRSIRCGPPEVRNADELATLLRRHNSGGGGLWLRGVAYHGSVAGDIDRHWLDRHIPDRPARIQHRGGRLWVFNSRGLSALGLPCVDEPPGLERVEGKPTGRLYEGDLWLRSRLPGDLPDLREVSTRLAGYGVTGLTDATPANGVQEWDHFRQAQRQGRLLQRVRMMGGHALGDRTDDALLQRGEYKIHLLESALPDPDAVGREISVARAAGRSVAIHCVTLVELAFAVGLLREAGPRPGDRIEHASVTSPELLEAISTSGLRIVTQPQLIAERGDQYLTDVEPAEQPWLYRCGGFLAAGVPLAGGSDAPFGRPDPWFAMRSAVERRTASGTVMAAAEALSPEQALALFLSPPATPGFARSALVPGATADLCLLDAPWSEVRSDLDSRHIRLTWRAGELIHGEA